MEKGITEDLQAAKEMQDKVESAAWLVDPTLPRASDNDQTIPMDLSSGIPVAVGLMLQEEQGAKSAETVDTVHIEEEPSKVS